MPERSAAVFVTCTKRKTCAAAPSMCLGRVAKGRPADVAAAWISRLEAAREGGMPARRLYCGDHGKIAAELPHAARQAGVAADLWVVSAGYGLVPCDAIVASYSATFSQGHPDEIVRRFQPALANAKSIPVAAAIQERFDDLDYLHDIGELDLNISGCINACGHHHVGHIGILGVDKNSEEWYQIEIGGVG